MLVEHACLQALVLHGELCLAMFKDRKGSFLSQTTLLTMLALHQNLSHLTDSGSSIKGTFGRVFKSCAVAGTLFGEIVLLLL